MSTKKYNLMEGSKWKELARQGKLSQKDFDTLKTSSVGKKYLNPRYIMKNKERGQKKELDKVLKKHGYKVKYDIAPSWGYSSSYLDGNKKLITITSGPNPSKYDNTEDGWGGSVRPTALQRRMIAAHEKDEAIQSLKKYNKIDKLDSDLKFYNYKNKDFITHHPNLNGIKNRLRSVENIDDLDIMARKNHAANGILKGFSHHSGVLNREFELRNLLYPSYRNSGRKKSQSFSGGKYTVFRLINGDKQSSVNRNNEYGEIDWGKLSPKKQFKIKRHNNRVVLAQIMKNRLERDKKLYEK